MATSSSPFKLGVFTLLAILALVLTAFGLGIRGVRADTVKYHTYFDESVQGLEIGAPVKYRGVPIGSVADVTIAPDQTHVDVALALVTERITKLPLNGVRPRLRAQLGTQGITGVKFVDIDFFDPTLNPPPALPFAPAENYIPAAPSLLKGIGDNLERVGQRLPALVDAMTETLHKIDALLGDIQKEGIASRVASVLGDIDGTVADLRRVVVHTDGAHLPERTAAALDGLSASLAKMDTMLDQVGGDGGLVASTRRATDSIGDLGRTTNTSAQQIGQTLRDLDQAALALRGLADSLQRDPQMLLQGHAPVSEP